MSPSMRRAAWPLVIALLGAALWFGRVHRDLPDFEVYRTAASRALSAEALYRPDDGHWQYKYLPAFAIAMAPFAMMPDAVARPLWFVLSIALVVVFVRRSVEALPDKLRSVRALTWLAVLLLGRFYVHELDLGQTNILLGVVLILALAAVDRRQPVFAGVLVGLAVFIKPYALILVPWLPIASGAVAIGAFAVVLVIGLLAPAVLYGWAGNLTLLFDWLRTVTETTTPNLMFPENISLAAMWARWLGGPSDLGAWIALASAAVLLLLAARVVTWRPHATEPHYLDVGFLLLLVPLVSPQGWDYVLLIATPAFLCLVNTLPRFEQPARAIVTGALAVIAFTIFDLLGRSIYMQVMSLAAVSVATLVIVVALAGARQRGWA